MTVSRWLVKPNTYRDSVELMRIAAQLEQAPGVTTAALLMATPANLELLQKSGLLDASLGEARPNDLITAIRADDDGAAAAAITSAEALLSGGATTARAHGTAATAPPTTIADAVRESPAANLAIISTPGPYAAAEAMKALKRGLHVFLFSDNVPAIEEIELKQLARARDLLVMGPDCGTAILDRIPLGFANVVRPGPIGLVGASGTGLQEVSCLIDRLGSGVSQIIGVGGHDLSDEVGGLMMLSAIERLGRDPDTAVVVLVSKPPSRRVTSIVRAAARATGKPTVEMLLGAPPLTDDSIVSAASLEEAAVGAVALATGREPPALGHASATRPAPVKGRILGLFSGGTLCSEAEVLLARHVPSVPRELIDLGADEYTVGRPHPMIDPRLRSDLIARAAADPDVGVILLDVVLGHGSHPDPAGALVGAIATAQERSAANARSLRFVASVCGTEADPQLLSRQEATLANAGVLLAPSNARAARLAGVLASGEGTP